MKILKRMGVMNITPDSLSDGGDFFSPDSIQKRLQFLSQFEIIDIGAESTNPKSTPLTWSEEWERWQLVLPFLKGINTSVSADTYHPETIFELVKFWKDHKIKAPLIWNDVSGKFDDSVKEFLKSGHDYIFCHNLAPSRALSGRHIEYSSEVLDLENYFRPYVHPQVIFDPCLGFSKSYEQNWEILSNFNSLSEISNSRWVIGISRKSFLRKKYQTQNNEALDAIHQKEIEKILMGVENEIWIRTHRPELLLI